MPLEYQPERAVSPLPPDPAPVFEAPEQEAAFFYGLFLRGYSYAELRQDIAVPPEVEAKWRRTAERDPQFRTLTDRMLSYRRRVLAIFQQLIAAESPSVQ